VDGDEAELVDGDEAILTVTRPSSAPPWRAPAGRPGHLDGERGPQAAMAILTVTRPRWWTGPSREFLDGAKLWPAGFVDAGYYVDEAYHLRRHVGLLPSTRPAMTILKDEPAAMTILKDEPAATTIEGRAMTILKEDPAAMTIEGRAMTILKDDPAAMTILKDEPAATTILKDDPAAMTILKDEP